MVNKIVRLKQTIEDTGLPRSSIYRYVKAGTFPAPIKLSDRSIGFLESELNEWLESRVSISRQVEAHDD